jgi:hypothetical protein
MALLLFANNAQTNLASGISSTVTTLSVSPATGSLFPNPVSGQEFYATITDVATETIHEIVLCTARSGDSLTVVRGVDGTTAKIWTAGSIFAMLVTAGTQQRFVQHEEIYGVNIVNNTGLTNPAYPLLTTQLTGTSTTVYTSNPNYQFNPTSGQLRAETFYANNGVFLNNSTINTSLTIPTGQNAMSTGVITQPSGVVVTVSAGSRWVIL